MFRSVVRCASLAAWLVAPLTAIAQPAPEQVIDEFHADMAAGKAQQALALLTDDVLIFEQGFADAGRQAYGVSDFKSDVAFAQATKYQVVNRHIYWFGDNAACVVTQSRMQGEYEKHEINLIGTETAVLHKFGSRWQIQHIHWSAHPADKRAVKR